MRWSELPGVIIGLLWIGVCCLAVYGVWMVGRAEISAWLGRLRSRKFVTTNGQVCAASVERFARLSVPRIEYEYVVAETTYRSERMAFQSPGYNATVQSAVYRILEQYPVDGVVKVYYDPKNPSDSTLTLLKPGCMLPIFFVMVVILSITLLLLSFGLVSLVESIQKFVTP